MALSQRTISAAIALAPWGMASYLAVLPIRQTICFPRSDLRVWQKAHEFVLAVYRYSESFPEREKLWADAPTAARGRFHSS
jgi:hypothetical protein